MKELKKHLHQFYDSENWKLQKAEQSEEITSQKSINLILMDFSLISCASYQRRHKRRLASRKVSRVELFAQNQFNIESFS